MIGSTVVEPHVTIDIVLNIRASVKLMRFEEYSKYCVSDIQALSFFTLDHNFVFPSV